MSKHPRKSPRSPRDVPVTPAAQGSTMSTRDPNGKINRAPEGSRDGAYNVKSHRNPESSNAKPKRSSKKQQSSFPESSKGRTSGRTTGSNDSSWDPVARWYAQWVGNDGSDYHRRLAIPVALDLLDPCPSECIADIGCGTGILATYLPNTVDYIGIDLSPRLIQTARRIRGSHRTFLVGDATRLHSVSHLRPGRADAAVFILSIQDMDPLEDVLTGASWLVKQGGRIVIVMFHPCFRVPRQSGWGWDDSRALQYRRVDSYLTEREVPVRPIKHGAAGSIKAYHRPLEAYINGLSTVGFQLTRMEEVPAFPGIKRTGPRARSENRANQEIPLLLGLQAIKRM